MSKLAVTTGIVRLWLSSLTILSAQSLSVTEYATSSGGAGAIVTGPDGALWFTEGAGIGRITTAGSLTEYHVPPDTSGSLLSITSGPDGALWYVETFNNKIARITTAGVVTEFPIPTSGTNPWGIASGPDGAVWFTEQYANIGRITTAGVITEYPIPTSNPQPGGIIAGPDGALWFTETIGDKIGRITTSGVITEYPIPTATSQPTAITAGPDGALWFIESLTNKIGRITTSGAITEYLVPASASQLGPVFPPVPQIITTGSDGAIWFTEPYAKQLGRITTAGVLTQYQLSPAGSPANITSGPDGALWFGISPGGIGKSTPPVGAPAILSGGIVNAASYAAVNGVGSPVAPGSLVAIFTSALSAQAAVFSTTSLPNSLGGVGVTFGGFTAPMVQVVPTGAYPFVSAQVPFEVLPAGQASATVPVVITVNNVPSAPIQTPIVASSPGIFTIPATGQGNAVLVNLSDYSIAAPTGSISGLNAHPIPRGQSAFFYVTGLGALTPAVADGTGTCPAANGLCNANSQPTVLVGGVQAIVAFAGQASGFPGVLQINITVPQNAPTGNTVSLIVKSGDGTIISNSATIAVQ
jgi:virginiamycin B lyase